MKSSYYPAPSENENKAAQPQAPVASSKVSAVKSALFAAKNYLSTKLTCKGKGTLDDDLMDSNNPSEIEEANAVAARKNSK